MATTAAAAEKGPATAPGAGVGAGGYGGGGYGGGGYNNTAGGYGGQGGYGGGYGSMIAQPLLRKAVEGREHLITEEEARHILKTSLRVLFYRDARSLNKVLPLILPSQPYRYLTCFSSTKLQLPLTQVSPSLIRLN